MSQRGMYTVKNGVFRNRCLGCLNVHSSTTPNRVFLKPPFEGVTGHPRTALQVAVNHLKGCYANNYTINSQLYIIVSDFFYILHYLIVLLTKKNPYYYAAIRGEKIALINFG